MNPTQTRLKIAGSLVIASLLAIVPAGAQTATVLDSTTMTEAQVRTAIEGASPGDVFFVTGTTGWTLTERLDIPAGVTLVGSNTGSFNTFKRGFNGTAMATVKSNVNLYGIRFDGDRTLFSGDGVVAGSYIPDPVNPANEVLDTAAPPVQNVQWTRVIVRNCTGNAYILSSPHQNSTYLFCKFDDNDGAGVIHGATSAGRHSQNFWNSCHFSNNGDSCVIFQGPADSSIWEKGEFLNNDWIVFEHETGAGQTSYCVLIKDGCIRDNVGTLWMNRSGDAEGVAFVDCRIKHNAEATAAQLGITGKISMISVQGGKLGIEMRGGSEVYDNSPNFLVTNTGSTAGGKLSIMRPNYTVGNIFATNASLITTDTSLMPNIPAGGKVNVSSGVGLDPVNRTVVSY